MVLCYTEPGDSMYNQEIKKRFLASYNPGNVKKNAPDSIFSVLESQEIKLGKDLGEMNAEEASEVLHASGFNEYSTMRGVVNTLKHYTEWCLETQAFPVIPRGFFDITAGEIDIAPAVALSLFRDERELLMTLRLVRTFDQGYPEPVICCLAWLGLRIRETLILREEDVDLEARTISINGEIVSSGFSDDIRRVFEQFIDCDSSEREHRLGFRPVIKDDSTPYFLKRMLPENSKYFGMPFTYSQLSAAMGKLNRKLREDGYPDRLQYDDIWNSGCYHRLWELECSGVNVTAPENEPLFLSVFRNSKGYYNALRMYKTYKEAFSLSSKDTTGKTT